MTLPAPNLDDRRFQDIVDEAKKLIPRYCPEWTDHNVSDPGVALIELFAWMTDLMLYRLNQVPDRLYVKFLELIGVELYSAAPARTDIVFELAAPPTEPLRVPAGTQVGTDSPADDDPVVFMTEADLQLVQPELTACLTRTADGAFADCTDDLRHAVNRVTCFPSLRPGDALYLGFGQSLAGNLIRLDVVTSAEGAGIRPDHPPRQWQAWDGTDWRPVRLLSDTTGGFNTPGQVTLLLPARHEPLPVASTRAHWLRCRLMAPEPGQPEYDASPRIGSLVPVGLGGAASAVHAEPAPAELLGRSTGEPGQVFQTRRAPVLPRRAGEQVRLLLPRRGASGEEDWRTWSEVADFAEAAEHDEVYTWAGATGQIRFGPAVRDAAGAVRRYGATPPADAQVWVTGYRYGGGRRGNVGAGTLTALRTSLPSVARVYNLDPATGGVDPESVANAKLRGPEAVRGGQRAVTAADFERLALAAAPAAARARCLAPQSPADPVRVLVVPRVDVDPQQLDLAHLDLPEDVERSIADHLEAHRLLTMRVVVDRPAYVGISVAARVRASPGMRPETVRADAEAALYRYLNPLIGGPEGQGWPFRRDLNIGEVFALLNGVNAVTAVEEVVLFSGDLALPRGSRRTRDQRLGNAVGLPEGALFASCDHRVVVVQ